jgi:hypothetical protein
MKGSLRERGRAAGSCASTKRRRRHRQAPVRHPQVGSRFEAQAEFGLLADQVSIRVGGRWRRRSGSCSTSGTRRRRGFYAELRTQGGGGVKALTDLSSSPRRTSAATASISKRPRSPSCAASTRRLREADAAGVILTRDAYVFSHCPDSATRWCPNWVTQTFMVSAMASASMAIGCMTSAVSWPPRCSPPGFPSRSSLLASTMPGRPRRRTGTPTPCSAATAKPPTNSPMSSAELPAENGRHHPEPHLRA